MYPTTLNTESGKFTPVVVMRNATGSYEHYVVGPAQSDPESAWAFANVAYFAMLDQLETIRSQWGWGRAL